MKYISTIILGAIVIFFNSFTTTLYAQITDPSDLTGADDDRRVINTAVPFLTITPDARAGGMGDVGAATSADANSVYWNPAKLVYIENDIGFSLSYTPWLGKIINDMSISYLSGYYKLSEEQAISLSMKYFNLGEIYFTSETGADEGNFNPREFAIDAAYSRKLTQNLSIGVAGRYIHSNLTGSYTSGSASAQPGNSVAADLAMYYNKDLLLSGSNSNIALAAVISNIGSKLTYSDEDNKDFIPTNLRLGTAFTTNFNPYNSLTFGLDFNKLLVPSPQADSSASDKTLLSGIFGSFSDAQGGFSEELKEVTISAGLEYWYNKTFAARAGYFYESKDKGNRKYLTLGLGFRYQVFGIDFAYLVPSQQEHPLAETLRFTLLFNFDQASKDQKSVVN
ncbi:type IX secretion system outer membrane channel protein PorV [Fulvivirga sediminis]|uniref:Type IX secretion system outer membrane channel protein PorV n=1 Tax=Fulvivirga sediminis TaxID=2803949 RepID=A0A937F7D1_9BACT|nr:type IX secretion system outer membrane channel protein PorV [Fulvivirga sediminis]MBL3657095.1 type IX secretion system outer membrane channel protein PorV [Fulvivirga sediminis]